MDRVTEPLVAELIKDLMNSVWRGAAESIIEKKLALQYTHLQILEFIDSYVSNSTANKEIGRVQMYCQKDPSTIPMDNIAFGEMQKQTRLNNSPRKQSVNGSLNQTSSRRFTNQSFNRQKSSPAKDQSQGLLTLPDPEDPHFVQDPLEDKCRTRIFQSQKQQSDLKKRIIQRQKQRSQSGVRNAKLLKDLKKITYDFDGKFFSVSQAPSNQQKISKIEKQNGEQSVVKKQTKIPEAKNINNEKMKQRESRNKDHSKQEKNAPQFNENRPLSLLDMFEEDTKLSEGIKIISEKGNEKIVKEKPREKLTGLRKYRREEFQNIVKQKKFKKLVSQYSSATIDPNKTTPLPQYNPQIKARDNLTQKQSLNTHSQISLVIKKQQVKPTLPPIQSIHMMKKSNKIGVRRLSVGFQDSSRSLLNQSGVESRRSKKSSIKIDHEALYLQNFTLDSYGR